MHFQIHWEKSNREKLMHSNLNKGMSADYCMNMQSFKFSEECVKF